MEQGHSQVEEPDVIVVGAGAGGAVLAARLVEAGLSVLVLEAGGDPCAGDRRGDARDLVADYRVPAFHAFASEHPGMADNHWVHHYDDQDRRRRDWRHDAGRDGVLYPRAKGLGGCASHNAMIVVRPNDCDWNHIAEVTGDASWRATRMQAYWERIERCRYRAVPWRWLYRLTGWNPLGHGWSGWLQTERAFPLRVLRDRPLRRSILRSMGAAADAYPGLALDWESTSFDGNARRLWNAHASGARIAPMCTKHHARHGPRERLLEVHKRHPDRLTIRLGVRVERVEVTGGRATAVHYTVGGQRFRATARHEIALAAGTFATPKLLQLSGIGDPAWLTPLGIKVARALTGVGRNLQDRYEIAVVSRTRQPWGALHGVRYSIDDGPYRLWKWLRAGTYKSNGVLFSVALKSRPSLPVPDLFCFALLADFRGYYAGYSRRLQAPNYLSWVVLKAYTNNTAGEVRLISADPAAAPAIRFRYFDEGTPDGGADLDAVVAGVRFMRKIADGVGDAVEVEEEPGRQTFSDDALRAYVKDNAWGHHACGTCAMRPQDRGGVVDSRFRVHGVAGLRVVDASVFSRIPGYFLVSAVFMIAEKAADTIAEDIAAKGQGRNARGAGGKGADT
ncbi:MAG: choline dehydrogenase [Rhodobacteraceae bacterium]|nr:choline dehydrogenase [Paracoccaceae bacterium]